MGLTSVEIPLYWQVIEDQLFDLRRADDLLDLAEDNGVRMHAGTAAIDLALPFDIVGLPISAETVAFNIELAKRVIDVGASLGLEVIRVCEPNIEAPHLDIADAYMEAYGFALNGLGGYAETRGLKVVAENYGITAAQTRTLLDAADHPNVGTLFDPCNYFRIGDDPVDALRLMGDKVFYCHLKDAISDDQRASTDLYADSRWRPSVAVGQGDIDWHTLIPALASVYAGIVAIEYEMPDDVVAATAVSRDFLLDFSAVRTS
ncbi:MAG: sugar phosphate isomerase/epimerase [Actinomycetia bacterium]|nr:sugar phosphate isomerase/epimerase [Actinomycetes bacterium]